VKASLQILKDRAASPIRIETFLNPGDLPSPPGDGLPPHGSGAGPRVFRKPTKKNRV
jgi:hypothetical protein